MATWSDEAIERLYAGAKAGEDIAAVAAALGMRKRDVEAKAERLRIKWGAPKPAAPVQEPMPAPRSEVSGRFGPTGRWDHVVIDRLRALVATGSSAAEASRALSGEFGESFSRNAVIGKAARLGIVFAGGAAAAARAIATKPAPVRAMKAARAAPEWGDAKEQQLRDLARAGRSAREIADTLGTSKGAVIGKAARMMVRLQGKPRPATRRPAVDPGAPDPALSVLFLERARGQCAAILDDSAHILERRCCGAPVSGESFEFCAHHRLRYTIAPTRAAA